MKIDLYEYVKEIITKSNLCLEENGVPGLLVDNDKKVIVKRSGINEIYIELNDKYEGNFKKVEIEKLKSNDWEAIKFNLLLNKATKTYNVNIVIANDCSIKIINTDRKIFTLSFKDNKIVIHNYKTKTERFVDTNNLNVENIIEELGDIVHNAHVFNGWKKDIDELFDIIKPCIILDIKNIIEEWENNIGESMESILVKIDDIDRQINMLKELRTTYLSKVSSLKLSSDMIKKNKTR